MRLFEIGILLSVVMFSMSCTKAIPKRSTTKHNGTGTAEVVTVEKIEVVGDIKTVVYGNSNGKYTLTCSIANENCISPSVGKTYLLFKSGGTWRFPAATTDVTLDFIQDWAIKYNHGENIGVIAEYPDGTGPKKFGVYQLQSWEAH